MNCRMTGVAITLTITNSGNAANKTVCVNLPTSEEAIASNVLAIARTSSFPSELSYKKESKVRVLPLVGR